MASLVGIKLGLAGLLLLCSCRYGCWYTMSFWFIWKKFDDFRFGSFAKVLVLAEVESGILINDPV